MQIPKILFPAAAGAAIERIAMPGDSGLIGAGVGAGIYYWNNYLVPQEVLVLGGSAGAGYIAGQLLGFEPLIGAAGLGALAYWRYSTVNSAANVDMNVVNQQLGFLKL